MSTQNPKKPDKSAKDGHQSRQHSNAIESGSGNLAGAIIDSLDAGVIACDRNLKIVHANSSASAMIDLGEYIDRSLATGTDAKVWNNWTDLLKSTITTGQKGLFRAVRYSYAGHKRLLQIACTQLREGPGQESSGLVVVIEDVSEQVDVAGRLSQAERFAAVGKVAGKVAHELNNPMDGILRYLNLAIRVIANKDLDKATEYLHHCRSGLGRMVQIISELLEFSRSTCPAFESAPLDEIVGEAVKSMDSGAKGTDIRIIRNFKGEMPRFRSSNLFQVFSNLIKNAADAMEGAGELTITISGSSGELVIEFSDTGPGFEPENAEAIFEPFFTTKSRSRAGGLGLGLAICKDIVEKYNGRITAQNSPAGGGIFTVHLPLEQEEL
ncbi:MAG: sensor histidine kinase [Planctomycetota bacterium]|jgi:signal transduction histidine kinase